MIKYGYVCPDGLVGWSPGDPGPLPAFQIPHTGENLGKGVMEWGSWGLDKIYGDGGFICADQMSHEIYCRVSKDGLCIFACLLA